MADHKKPTLITDHSPAPTGRVPGHQLDVAEAIIMLMKAMQLPPEEATAVLGLCVVAMERKRSKARAFLRQLSVDIDHHCIED